MQTNGAMCNCITPLHNQPLHNWTAICKLVCAATCTRIQLYIPTTLKWGVVSHSKPWLLNRSGCVQCFEWTVTVTSKVLCSTAGTCFYPFGNIAKCTSADSLGKQLALVLRWIGCRSFQYEIIRLVQFEPQLEIFLFEYCILKYLKSLSSYASICTETAATFQLAKQVNAVSEMRAGTTSPTKLNKGEKNTEI